MSARASAPFAAAITVLVGAALAWPSAAPAAALQASPPPAAATTAEPSAEETGPLPPGPRMTAPEYRLGNPRARVTVVEYASDTCPHCARFAADVFPEFKKKYIDPGKVLYVFREYPTDPVQISAAGFVLARCTGETHYFDVVNALFQAQATSNTVLDFLLAGAKAAGLNQAQMKECLNVKEAFDDLNARVRAADETSKISGTPTFIVNGVKLPGGEKSLKELDDAIAPLLGKGAPKPTRRTGKA